MPQLVPYAPDFTPTAMARGGVYQEDEVLPWLLRAANTHSSRSELLTEISESAFGHIEETKNRRDMASHVVQALGNYGLLSAADDGSIALTEAGRALLQCAPRELDVRFARHILTRCGGLALINEIRTILLRGETPQLESLASVLDRHETSKSISSMRSWLERAGIFPLKRKYAIDETAISAVLGARSELICELNEAELEFLLAVRACALSSGDTVVQAADAARVARARRPDVSIPRKSLGSFVSRLETRGFLTPSEGGSGKGGARRQFTLNESGIALADEELRGLWTQSELGFPLGHLRPLEAVIEAIGSGHGHELGLNGEMLAAHVCLMLGLHVVDWRKRVPDAEIDLLAERVMGLSYERWAIQAKNVGPDATVSTDRVDREVGAIFGTGVTHVLLLAPRARVATNAKAEACNRTRLTGIHVYYLDRDAFLRSPTPANLVALLEGQRDVLAQHLRHEAKRRLTLSG